MRSILEFYPEKKPVADYGLRSADVAIQDAVNIADIESHAIRNYRSRQGGDRARAKGSESKRRLRNNLRRS